MTPEQKTWLEREAVVAPALRQFDGTKTWEFCERYEISLPPPHWPLRLVIPAGWRYDRSSIPEAVPDWLVSRDDLGTLAPAPHDAGYRVRGEFYPDDTAPQIVQEVPDGNGGPSLLLPITLDVTRAEVDAWFLLYLLRQRIPRARAYAAYYAVRGWWGVREFFGLSQRW